MINSDKERQYWVPERRGFITNYPNFMHWKRLEEAGLAGILEPLNIYIHIPFCAQKCSYCYYRTVQNSRKSEIDAYVDALCKEIEMAADRFNLARRPLTSVYFGGGTPTLLTGDNLLKIRTTLDKCVNVTDQTEITVEGEPVTITDKKAQVLGELNVTRISMGVQSLHDEIIKLSHRQDTQARALRAIEMSRKTGASVNIDLMSGLAGDTPETWAYSVAKAIETEVESITVYKTELYTNTEYYKELRSNKITLPDDAEELEYMQHAMDEFAKANYVPWSFFTFTKDDKYRHIHSPSIWHGEDFYAIGASAFGRMGDYLIQNTNEVGRYVEMIEGGNLPIHRGHKMSSMDKIIRDVVLGMKLVTIDLESFYARHGVNLPAFCKESVDRLTKEGYITVTDTELKMTDKGILHGDLVGKDMSRSLMEMYT
ncbi:MAG: coproporphyrinogen-III oxidase family protein [Thiotrichaceae bacterium]|nr:coproporphyrinogen-III oxidase family protein [Thiotrichaceae bacterium]